MAIALNDIVVVESDGNPFEVRSGDAGIVVQRYDDGQTFEVEFIGIGSSTTALLTLDASEIRLAEGHEFPTLQAHNKARKSTSGYRQRYAIWLGFALVSGIVTARVLEPIAVIPAWQVYAGIIVPLVFVVSIPHLIVMSRKSQFVSGFLKVLILISAILSLVASYLLL